MLFDLDGVLVDSSPLHEAAFREALSSRGIALTEEARALIHQGAARRRVLRALIEPGALLDELAQAKGEALLQLLSRQPVAPIRGALGFLRELRRLGLASAVASNSLYAAAFVERLGARELFDAVVTPDDVERPKPAPDLYTEAARRLGLDAAECWAVEDSLSGASSAHAAGATVFLLGGSADQAQATPYTHVADFAALTLRLRSCLAQPETGNPSNAAS